MEKKIGISETVKRRVARLMFHIEFMGIEDRSNEVASVYNYLGLKSTICKPKKLDLVNEKKWIKGFYIYNSIGDCIQVYKATNEVYEKHIRLVLPRYNITVEDNDPTMLVYYLTQKADDFKKKFDVINREINNNRKRINNARESLKKNVELVNDFLGKGNKLVSAQDFKAYITGLSVANHNLKKKAKSVYAKYMAMKALQDIIINHYIGEDGFNKFYKQFCKVCKQYRTEDEKPKKYPICK